MKIYTKTGDKGQTSLANGKRVSKSDNRLEAYGTADELNSFVGLLRCCLKNEASADAQLEWLQNKIFNLGADLSAAPGEWITAADTQTIEQWIDQMQATLSPFRGFVLPGGSESVSLCHVCRTITRRLERQMSRLVDENDLQEIREVSLEFVNRLSDYWFVLAQNCAKNEGIEPIFWKK